MSITAGQRRWIATTLASGCALLLLYVLYGGALSALLSYLRNSSRVSVQQAALEVARPVVHGVVDNGVPPTTQIWGLRTVRPLTAESAGNAFERDSLALATSPAGTVHSTWQARPTGAVVEFAIADGRGGVAVTEVGVDGGLATIEAHYQQIYDMAARAGLVICAMLCATALVAWCLRRSSSSPGARTRPARETGVPDSQAALQPRQELTRLMRAVHGSSQGHWELDYDSGHFWRSATFEQLLGRASDDATGTIDEFEQMPHPADTERVRFAFERHVETGAPFEVEVRLLCAGGDWRWFRYRATGEFVQGTMVRLAGSISDIERIALEQDERTLDAEDVLQLLTPRGTGTS